MRPTQGFGGYPDRPHVQLSLAINLTVVTAAATSTASATARWQRVLWHFKRFAFQFVKLFVLLVGEDREQLRVDSFHQLRHFLHGLFPPCGLKQFHHLRTHAGLDFLHSFLLLLANAQIMCNHWIP